DRISSRATLARRTPGDVPRRRELFRRHFAVGCRWCNLRDGSLGDNRSIRFDDDREPTVQRTLQSGRLDDAASRRCDQPVLGDGTARIWNQTYEYTRRRIRRIEQRDAGPTVLVRATPGEIAGVHAARMCSVGELLCIGSPVVIRIAVGTVV